MRNNKKSKHEFAFYHDGLTNLIKHLAPGAQFSVSDEHVLQRMRVVRMSTQDPCILFDRDSHLSFLVQTLGKKRVEGVIKKINKNNILSPTITFCLPLLKRDHFESALYAMVELGATNVQLVITDKVQRSWGGQKEYMRALHVMIAAAEQSKNFAFPQLLEPCSLQELCQRFENSDEQKLFFDPCGKAAAHVFESLRKKGSQQLVLLVGPEGDLSASEKLCLEESGFIFCALTPTILRAFQATVVSLGMARTLLD